MTNGDRNEDPALAFFRDLAQSVSLLQEKATLLQDLDGRVQDDLKLLSVCDYQFDEFKQILGRIQSEVSRLSLYDNMRR